MKVPRHLCVVLMTQQGALHSRGCDLNTTALQLFKNILRYNKKWHPVEFVGYCIERIHICQMLTNFVHLHILRLDGRLLEVSLAATEVTGQSL